MIQDHAVDIPPALVLLEAPLTIVSFILVRRIYGEAILGKPVAIADAE